MDLAYPALQLRESPPVLPALFVWLFGLIPESFVKISESGISDPQSIHALRDAHFKGFLIGETFMKTEDPAKTLAEFIASIN
jgi:indole-3-glycerol phosphate synthase